MTAEEKARELVAYFLYKKPMKLDEQLVVEHPTAVEFARKVVIEVIESISVISYDFNFWLDVLDELGKM